MAISRRSLLLNSVSAFALAGVAARVKVWPPVSSAMRPVSRYVGHWEAVGICDGHGGRQLVCDLFAHPGAPHLWLCRPCYWGTFGVRLPLEAEPA